LTLFESETYTQLMKDRRIFSRALLVAALGVAGTIPSIAQTRQRSMVSVLNDAGARSRPRAVGLHHPRRQRRA
jgi:hypothetical protein